MVEKQTRSTLDILEAEFAPRLDTTLIAAIAADYINPDGTVSQENTTQLQSILSELAAQAEKDDDLASQFSNSLRISPTEGTSGDDHDLFSTSEGTSAPYTAITSNPSSGSDNGTHSLKSPLDFLRAAFPHLPSSRLRSALGSSEDVDGIDMEAVVGDILSQEYVKELEERGLEDEEPPIERNWEPVRKKKSKKPKKSTQVITLGDIRQQQYSRSSSKPSSSPYVAPVDPWTQLSSVATRLSDILPTVTSDHFRSMFHSPKFSSPAEALRDGLRSLKADSSVPDGNDKEETELVFNLFEILTENPAAASLSDYERDQLMDDVTLAVNAVLAARPQGDGTPEAALDLVTLLRELDNGNIEWSVYHSPSSATASQFPTGSGSTSRRSTLPAGPPSPPRVRPRGSSASSARNQSTSQRTQDAWQTIPVVQRGYVPSPHAEFIPAYNPTAKMPKGRHAKRAQQEKENLKKLDVLDPYWHRRRAGELMEKRKEALMQASRAWQRANGKNRGGEVALTYAEHARELQEEAKRESLDAALTVMHAKLTSSVNGNTIDLHGTTIAEAVHVVRSILDDTPATTFKPLKIITGKGTHSANRVGVLGPAIHTALTEDGWNVSKWDGGLVVRGRS